MERSTVRQSKGKIEPEFSPAGGSQCQHQASGLPQPSAGETPASTREQPTRRAAKAKIDPQHLLTPGIGKKAALLQELGKSPAIGQRAAIRGERNRPGILVEEPIKLLTEGPGQSGPGRPR